MDFSYVDLGRALERVAFVAAILTALLAALAVVARDRRLVAAARNTLIGGGVAILGAAGALVGAFFEGAYGIDYVFHYSERKVSAQYKLAGLWAGLDGSILLWAMILGVIGAALAWSFRKRGLDPSGRRLEPYVYVVFACVQVFFLAVICLQADPFAPINPDVVAGLSDLQGRAARGPYLWDGIPRDGKGLNPLLENYWMTIHPPSVYLGFILYTVPFAFGMAALAAGEFSSYWIRTTRRWTMVAWLFNTTGIVLGGLWAYEVLGWGGYWAWDPVENASFLPWLTGTAFLHSVMIQERRDMLRVWNALLIAMTFVLSIFGTYLTRSGIVSSVHAFAGGEIGQWFLAFLLLLIAASVFLLFFRMRDLRSANSIDSLLSREGVFLLNNMVLVAIAVAIVLLTLWPKISNEFLKNPITLGVPVYNRVCVPFFLLLFFLTALGPSTAWVRTSVSRFLRNLLVPAILAIAATVATLWVSFVKIRGGDAEQPLTPLDHVYPTGVLTFLGWWIVLSLAWEFVRTVAATGRATGRDPVTAALRVVVGNNRRWGGYVVHAGLAIMGIGIASSTMYATEHQNVPLVPQKPVRIGPYEYEVTAQREAVPVSAYLSTKLDVTVRSLAAGGGPDAVVGHMAPEYRFYPATAYRQQAQPQSEVAILHRPGEDLYLYFEKPGPNGFPRTAEGLPIFGFTIFRKPLILLVWGGWIVMLAGGLFAAAPLGRRKVGLAA